MKRTLCGHFIVLNMDMVALLFHAVKSAAIYYVYASFLLRNRYSSSCFLISSGISLATGQTAAFAKRFVKMFTELYL